MFFHILSRKRKFFRFRLSLGVVVALSLLLISQISSYIPTVFATLSPWSRTDWSGGGYQSATGVVTAVTGQLTLNKTESLTNTGFESDTSGWTMTSTINDSGVLSQSGLVASWPLDDTNTSQSVVRVLNPSVATGRNILPNGDYELGNTTGVTAGNTASLSAQTSTPHAGAYSLRVTRNGTNNPQAQTTIFVLGKVYRYHGWARSDGSATPTVYMNGGTAHNLTTSTNWQEFDYTETAPTAGAGIFIMRATTSTGSQYCEFDDVTVTELNITASTGTPVNLLSDGNMETSGTSAWTTLSGTPSKQTTSPHGGSQVIRLTSSGVGQAQVSQAILTVGKVYRVYGYARSDGTGIPGVFDGTNYDFSGTTSTAWQPFDFTFVAASGTNLRFYKKDATTSGYVEFDDVTVVEDTLLRPDSNIISTTDGDMEAVGTSYWNVYTGTTLSKATTSPHGGSQVLRVTKSGGADVWAFQNVLIVGKTYRVTGYVRSDGNATPKIYTGSQIWQGATSTSWQYFDVVTTTNSASLWFGMASGNVGWYVDFDDVTVTEVSPMIGKFDVTGGVPTTKKPTLGADSGGHLSTAYSFNAANSQYVNIYSGSLNSAFNPAEGTMVVWAKVSGAGVWTDTTVRYLVDISDNSTSSIFIRRSTTNNRLISTYQVGGVTSTVNIDGQTSTGFIQLVITWSKSADQAKFYINGVQTGTTQTGLGTWGGNLNNISAVIGAATTSGTSPWSGLINDVRLYGRALTSSEVTALYTGSSFTRDTTITNGSSAGSAKVAAAADQDTNLTQNINVGDTNSYNLSLYAYTNGSPVTSSDAQLYVGSSTVNTTYTSVGGGWYKLTAAIQGSTSSVNYGVQVKAGKTVYLDDFSLNKYLATGTLTSDIFDAGNGMNWGVLTYNSSTPANTGLTVKVRTGNQADMSDALSFDSCTSITSGQDISSNTCVTDGRRYAQYQVVMTSTTGLSTPVFNDISLDFASSDTEAPVGSLNTSNGSLYTASNDILLALSATDNLDPVSQLQMEVSQNSDFSGASYEAFSTSKHLTLTGDDGLKTVSARFKDSFGNVSSVYRTNVTLDTVVPALTLDSPADVSYTNSVRSIFRWKGSDATSGLSKYKLEVDNPSLGLTSNLPSGDFEIDNIPVSGSRDTVTDRYVVHFDNSSTDDDYVSVYTKTSSGWTDTQNDGALREGRVSWKLTAVDKAGNQTTLPRTVFVDSTAPLVEISKVNDSVYTANAFSTTSKALTIVGRLTDHLGGPDWEAQGLDGPKVASGPKMIQVKIEKKSSGSYALITKDDASLSDIHFTCDDTSVGDNSKQKCDKYSSFSYTSKPNLDMGTYRVTLIGTDQAGNQTSISFTLNIGTLAQIITPMEKLIIEDIVKDLPQKTQEKIKDEIEITKPVGPLFSSTAQSQIPTTTPNNADTRYKIDLTGVITNVGKTISGGFTRITSVLASNISDLAGMVNRGATSIFQSVSHIAQSNTKRITQTFSQKTKELSDNFGFALVKVGYLFIKEPTAISDVKVTRVDATTATISWTTNHPANGKVNWGETRDYGQDVQSEELVTSHIFTISNLKANTTYHYEVMSQGKNYVYDADHSFATPEK